VTFARDDTLRSLRFVALLMAAPLGAAISQAPVAPTSAAPAASPATFTLRVDNDAFDFWMLPWNRPDQEYTSGVRLAYDGGDAPWWARGVLASLVPCAVGSTRCRTDRIELGQDMYSPARSVNDPNAAPGARANAGWLYVTQTARALDARSAHELAVTLGVTGPPSLGEQMQRLAHDVAPAYNRPADWSDQIAFQPGVVLGYTEQRRFVISNGPIGADVVPRASVVAGNVRDAATLGGDLRIGWHLRHPWLPAEGPISIAVTAGASEQAVARDLFLDGPTTRPAPPVGHEPFVTSGDLGLEFHYRAVMLGYRAQSDSRAYAHAPRWHPWASLVGGVSVDR
jgi:hypothetical protein